MKQIAPVSPKLMVIAANCARVWGKMVLSWLKLTPLWLSLAAASFSQAPSGQSAHDLIEEGDTAKAHGDYDLALRHYWEARDSAERTADRAAAGHALNKVA